MKAKGYIDTIPMPTANVEYHYVLPFGTQEFTLKLRDLGYELDVCFVSGDLQNYINLASGMPYNQKNIKGGNNILYFRSPSPNQTAEILYYK